MLGFESATVALDVVLTPAFSRPLGCDQAIERVIHVAALRGSTTGCESRRLLCLVVDLGDVADRIVGVAQSLAAPRAVGRPRSRSADACELSGERLLRSYS